MNPFLVVLIALVAAFGLLPIIVNAFLRNVEAGEIRLVSWMGGRMSIYRGPCKAMMIPLLTVSQVIPAQAINVDIEITDQTADLDANGRPAPVKVTVKASAIVSVGEVDQAPWLPSCWTLKPSPAAASPNDSASSTVCHGWVAKKTSSA